MNDFPASQMDRIEKIKSSLMQKHVGETVDYTGCYTNCGGSCCIMKVRVKDGKVTSIEPDDHHNTGVGVEDRVLTDIDLIKNRLQQRACPMAWVWHKQLSLPDRVLWPLKRIDGTRRGEGRFERISWDEALTTVAEKMKECKDQYGPYSIITPYYENPMFDPIFSFLGAGVQGWGWCSQDPERLARHLVVGYPGWSRLPSYDMSDFLINSKMIVLWGLDATMSHFGPGHQFAYYIKMARERGTPIICIDPRYTASAEALSEQWIPIKPGTDMAMMLAIAHVLMTESLYNREFVERYVEPVGFEAWRKYILGGDDGMEKTPEWAERICGVPAETIREFTLLYSRMKPTCLFKNWSVSRKSYGENSSRAAAMLQAMMGYIGGPGGYNTLAPIAREKGLLGPWIPLAFPMGLAPRKFVAPRMYRSNKWAEAVLLLEDVRKGKMTTEEYRRIIGWRANPDLPNPDPKMLLWGSYFPESSNTLVTGVNSVKRQISALDRMDLVVQTCSFMTPTAKYADIILPIAEPTLEDRLIAHDGYGGFDNIVFCPGVSKPVGEAKPYMWVYTKLAEKLGFGKIYNTFCTTENWDEGWERYLKSSYSHSKKLLENQGVRIPEWEKFEKDRSFNLDETFDKPLHGFRDELEGGNPFPTNSGKIEFLSNILADGGQRGKIPLDFKGRLIDNLPNDWRDMKPIPVYQPMVRGFEDPSVNEYPFLVLTPHSRYRVHSTFWNNPWLRGDVYRNSLWLNVGDAKALGVKDGDLVRVRNQIGEMIVVAYVTSRSMPGVVALHHGAWYDPDDSGVDRAGCPTVLLYDEESPVTAPHTTTLVQVTKH